MTSVDLRGALHAVARTDGTDAPKRDRRVLRTLDRIFGRAVLEEFPASGVWRFPSMGLRRMRECDDLGDETVRAYDTFLLQLWSRVSESGLLSRALTHPEGARLEVPPQSLSGQRGAREWRAAMFLAEALEHRGIRVDQLVDHRLPDHIGSLIEERFPGKNAFRVLEDARRHLTRVGDPLTGPTVRFPRTVPAPKQDYGAMWTEMPETWRSRIDDSLALAQELVPRPGLSLARPLSDARVQTWREEVCRLAGFEVNVRGGSLSRWASVVDFLSDLALIRAHVEWHIRTRCGGLTKSTHKGKVQIPADLLKLMGEAERTRRLRSYHASLQVSEPEGGDPRREAPELDPELVAKQTEAEWEEIIAEWNALRPLVRRRRMSSEVRRRFHGFVERLLGALFVDVLLREPMRLGNLTDLRLDGGDELGTIWCDERGVWHLAIPSQDVKNGEPIRRELPPVVCDHLSLYHDEVRPLLPGARSSDRLWLQATAGPFAPAGVRRRVQQHTERVFECRLNPKEFRPLAAVFFWLHHPEDIETARRLLRHRSSNTTKRFYLVVSQRVHSRIAQRYLRETAGRALRAVHLAAGDLAQQLHYDGI